jgi:hypothetical protein
LAVREEMGFSGVREQMAQSTLTSSPFLPSSSSNSPSNSVRPTMMLQPGGLHNISVGQDVRQAAASRQLSSTDREWAPSALYPSQQRPGEPAREVIPKNHKDFEFVGRNIGPHSTANAVGGYVGRDRVDEDVSEKFTQRTFDDFTEYYAPKAAQRTEVGNASVYSLHEQGRIDARELGYKDTPGRYGGAFRHELRNPDHPIEKIWQKDAYGEKPTMKADYWMAHRNRDAEHPNREGLRMQYADVYSPAEWGGFETLDQPRTKETEILQDIDVTMIRPWSTNPYTPPIGIVPFSNQNSTGLNSASPYE